MPLVILYTCEVGTSFGSLPGPVGHPCGRAAKALDDAGHSYDHRTVKGGSLKVWTWPSRAKDRAEIKRLSGQQSVPILVLDDGEVIVGSGSIVDSGESDETEAVEVCALLQAGRAQDRTLPVDTLPHPQSVGGRHDDANASDQRALPRPHHDDPRRAPHDRAVGRHARDARRGRSRARAAGATAMRTAPRPHARRRARCRAPGGRRRAAPPRGCAACRRARAVRSAASAGARASARPPAAPDDEAQRRRAPAAPAAPANGPSRPRQRPCLVARRRAAA